MRSFGSHPTCRLHITAHYFDPQWELQSHALTVMKTEERHFADNCKQACVVIDIIHPRIYGWGYCSTRTI